MAVIHNPRQQSAFLYPMITTLFLLIVSSLIRQSTCQSSSTIGSPQNIQVFYASLLTPPALQPHSAQKPVSSCSSASGVGVWAAVGITAVACLVLFLVFFWFIDSCCSASRKKLAVRPNPYGDAPFLPHELAARFGKKMRGVIVDEDFLDVVYWRNPKGKDGNEAFRRQVLTGKLWEKAEENKVEEKKMMIIQAKEQEMRGPDGSPFLGGNVTRVTDQKDASDASYGAGRLTRSSQLRKEHSFNQLGSGNSSNGPLPPSRPSVPPPPGPVHHRRNSPPPPPDQLPKTGASKSFLVPKGSVDDGKNKQPTAGQTEGGAQVRLKPLHWDKVNHNSDHSMVWDKVDGGSFKVDNDLMEALFGYVATSRKPSFGSKFSQADPKAGPSSQIFILDARKSQNIASVVKSLGASWQEIVDALIHGDDLMAGTLEKLSRIAPSKDEESCIRAFNGDPFRLAEAESFLYHILKSVPSAFSRFNAMLFRTSFKMEVSNITESLRTLGFGCKELRRRGLLLKLFEAVLRAGTRMKAGTSRGNAKAFNLSALNKLSDVKSTDGKTTLLHFVVEEVVRAEGKRCVLNLMNVKNPRKSIKSSENSQTREEKENDYTLLGLPIVGGLSVEFSNVKQAAKMDYDGLVKSIIELKPKVAEIQKLVQQSETDEGGLIRELRAFLDEADEEVRAVEEEQVKIMELVKRTTDYFQSGASKEKGWHPLYIFRIVNHFLQMVDKVCVDIARNSLQRKQRPISNEGVSLPGSPESRPSVKFPMLPADFMDSENSFSLSSD